MRSNVAKLPTQEPINDSAEEVNAEFSALMAGEVRRKDKTPDVIMNDGVFARLERIARLMASAVAAIPKHLHGNVSDCFAIAMQAYKWGMDPFILASKTHVVSGVLGYEGQVINSVIIGSGVIEGRPEFVIGGDWKAAKNNPNADAWVDVSATIKGEPKPRLLRLNWHEVAVKNSPLWKSKPDQQACYLAIKYWARRYAPDIIMGVYGVEELVDSMGRVETEINPVDLATGDDVVSDLIARVNACTTMADLATLRATAMTFRGAGRTEAADAIRARRKALEAPAESVNTETGEIQSSTNQAPINEPAEAATEASPDPVKEQPDTDQASGAQAGDEPNPAALDYLAAIQEAGSKSDISRLAHDIRGDRRLNEAEKNDLMDELKARQAVI